MTGRMGAPLPGQEASDADGFDDSQVFNQCSPGRNRGVLAYTMYSHRYPRVCAIACLTAHAWAIGPITSHNHENESKLPHRFHPR